MLETSPCPKCRINMYYDVELSKLSERATVYYCIECGLIVANVTYKVKVKDEHTMPFRTIRRIIVKGVYPKKVICKHCKKCHNCMEI